jgi:transglutaminase-like putative cysteine protease
MKIAELRKDLKKELNRFLKKPHEKGNKNSGTVVYSMHNKKPFTADFAGDDKQRNMHQDLELDVENNNRVLSFSGPAKLIAGIFMLLILLMWFVPYSYVPDNPHPRYTPEIREVHSFVEVNRSLPEIDTIDKYRLYIDTRDPNVKAVADRVSALSCTYSNNYLVCQSKALYFFVRDKFEYVEDPVSFEYVKTPLESMNNLGGDCDDASVLLASLLGSIGVRTRLVFVPRHVYVEAYLPGASPKYKSYRGQDWVVLDATCKNCDFGQLALKYQDAEKRYIEVT